ncbi:hypothetical protein PMNALOAF_2359 [Methylobacterium adhaesivum]|nr:hypothetical protein PMNALOAF_2359 [Methylobacterium adhaesivum]
MKRGQKTGAEQMVLKLRQIEVQSARSKATRSGQPGQSDGGTSKGLKIATPRPAAFSIIMPHPMMC